MACPPGAETAWQAISADPALSTFAQAVNSTGLIPVLNSTAAAITVSSRRIPSPWRHEALLQMRSLSPQTTYHTASGSHPQVSASNPARPEALPSLRWAHPLNRAPTPLPVWLQVLAPSNDAFVKGADAMGLSVEGLLGSR